MTNELLSGNPFRFGCNQPAYFEESPVFATVQCAVPWSDGIDYLLVLDRTARALEKDPSRGSHLDFADTSAAGWVAPLSSPPEDVERLPRGRPVVSARGP